MTERASLGFARKYRLGNNKNYRYVYRRGKSHPSKNLVLIYLKGKEQRFGFSVSSKVGNAVTRNRVRRLIKENYRLMEHELQDGYDIVIVARAKMATSDFHASGASLRTLFGKCGLLA